MPKNVIKKDKRKCSNCKCDIEYKKWITRCEKCFIDKMQKEYEKKLEKIEFRE